VTPIVDTIPMAAGANPRTLAVDVGGTGIKASVLDARGGLLTTEVRLPTRYPCPPTRLIETVLQLAGQLPAFDRVSVGFPGMVRAGTVLSAPHFVTTRGPGSPVDKKLTRAWDHFALAAAIEGTLGKPTKVVNDADLQGAAVIAGQGLEFVITLGTGVGTALFHDGALTPHLELAHHPFRNNKTYNEQLGDAARRRLGNRRWNKRVKLALDNFDRLIMFDHLYIGGGNAHRLDPDLGREATIVDNIAGILGGIRLWDGHVP